jgi:hypothetical protein
MSGASRATNLADQAERGAKSQPAAVDARRACGAALTSGRVPAPAAVLALQRSAGNRAVASVIGSVSRSGAAPSRAMLRRAPAETPREALANAGNALANSKRALEAVRREAEELIHRARGRSTNIGYSIYGPTGNRSRAFRRRTAWVIAELQALIDAGPHAVGGADRAQALAFRDHMLDLQDDMRARGAEFSRAKQVVKKTTAPPRTITGQVNVPGPPATPSVGPPGGTASVSVDDPALRGQVKTGKETTHVVSGTAGEIDAPPHKGGGGTATSGPKVEVAAADVAANAPGTLYNRVLSKAGRVALDLLIPEPLDAIELMIEFAGSYKEAWARIRHRNLKNGFAIGWAAYLVIPRWEWAKWFAHTVASKDVTTQVLGAVGVAENAFNEGLVRGFIYGEKHSAAQADRVRQKAFDVLAREGRTPGHDAGDNVYTFGRDDVYAFASVLVPTAVAVLAAADRQRKERLEAEQLRKDAERWSRVPTGADKW